MKKTIIFIFLIIFAACTFSAPVSAYEPESFEVSAEGALLVNIDTGDVLFSRNTDKRLYPASLTKLMTAAVVVENTDDLDKETLTVTKSAINSLLGTGLAVAGLKDGEELTARQILHLLLIPSAADAAEVIAEHYAGSDAGFVELMNQKAASLGMTGTRFTNVHGLHDDDHYTTVNDMYKLVSYIWNIPVLKEICGHARYTLPATNLSGERILCTTNLLIDPSSSYFYKYAYGVKTGFTNEAGRCLISTAAKDGYNYMCILMKCPNKNKDGFTVRYDFNETKKLYEWAFSTFAYKTVTTANKPVAEVNVELSSDTDHVSVVPKESLMSMIPKSAKNEDIRIEVKLNADTVQAPVEKGQVMGSATYFYEDEELGTVAVVASQSVKRSQLLAIWKALKLALSSTAFKVLLALFFIIVIAFIISVIIINRKRKQRRRRYKGW